MTFAENNSGIIVVVFVVFVVGLAYYSHSFQTHSILQSITLQTARSKEAMSTTSKENKETSITRPDDDGPVPKKLKTLPLPNFSFTNSDNNSTTSSPPPKQQKQQSNLFQFFGKKQSNNAKPPKQKEETKQLQNNNSGMILPACREETKEPPESINHKNNNRNDNSVPEPIIPKQVAPNPKARWKIIKDCMLVRCIKTEEPREKVAAFDVDGTLLVWRVAGWPSKFQDYELWSSGVVSKLQTLHDQGYKLVLFSNQGAIRSAVTGKKATFVKNLFEWIASIINRPVHIVLSTNKKMGYHKPNPGMWEICETYCNGGIPMILEQSFFVGDSVGDDDPQGGVDEKFAKNVGVQKGSVLKFFTPQDYFGPRDSEKRKLQSVLPKNGPPLQALKARLALLGGYCTGPIVLILAGVQGSGKSTFCQQLMDGILLNYDDDDDDDDDMSKDDDSETKHARWVHVSQDTIHRGKPGKREAVEEATRQALQNGQSVVVDRTHLDPSQRKYFIDIAKDQKVPVHCLLFNPSKQVISKRVRERINHPGGVQGEQGVRVALMHLEKLVVPNYPDEGFDLISYVQDTDGVQRFSKLYREVVHATHGSIQTDKVLPQEVNLACGKTMPTVVLGTMKVGKRVGADVVKTALQLGLKAIDTAPTYKNEDALGNGLVDVDRDDVFVITKIPKRATEPDQVQEEFQTTLNNLSLQKVDLLLLHWPCDVMEAGTLKTVWEAMEKFVERGQCKALGVCNFSVNALQQLLPHCTIPPAVNQVERHPLLPQMELLDFCSNQGILLQAHTPLGQGKLLTNDTITKVANKVKLTPAQVTLIWNLQHGVSVVPKSTTESHLKEIVQIFQKEHAYLSPELMEMLDGIKEKERFVSPPFMKTPGKVYSWED